MGDRCLSNGSTSGHLSKQHVRDSFTNKREEVEMFSSGGFLQVEVSFRKNMHMVFEYIYYIYIFFI